MISATEKDITRAIVVDDLLIDSVSSLLLTTIGQTTTSLNALIHGTYLHRIEGRAGRADIGRR